jgi:glycogen operon protein
MSEVLGRGRSFPLGATVQGAGVNFSIFCKHATRVELLLFDSADAALPSRVIELDPEKNRTFYYWHCRIDGIGAGQLYAYRAHGPLAPDQGMRFDGTKVLLDPYARAVTCVNYEREAAIRPGDNCARAMKGVVADPRSYDWEGDTPLCRPFAGSVIYELHVGGWTRSPSSGVAPERRGTYLGLIEKIPYLKDLGVTAVELLPVQHFDEQDAAPGRKNYWGYSPVALFAPHRGYCHGTDPLAPVREFCDLVKALHKAGIEVILDVVFNHTAEGGSGGPTLSFRGLANRGYYSLLPGDLARYADYSGCGNSLNANHSIVRRLIIDCLHYWVRMLHVDGFRFDLASVLARDANGTPLKDPPILWEIESDPVLAGTKIIAEAWDAAGLYQVGSFPGHRWAEWNGRYRDDVRRFVRGQEGLVADLRSRIAGSRDIYPQPQREPSRSINFITCHDGFTLNDLCSYDTKHNEDNGEENRDGSNQNDSSSYGAEGPTGDPAIEAVRLRQIKNLLVILLLSQGTPMLLMGDEVRRTQRGNNNAYCQDNELGWFNWEDVEKNAGLLRFVRLLIRLNRGHRVFQSKTFWSEPQPSPKQNDPHDGPQVIWHGVELHAPDLRPESHSLAFELLDPATGERLYVILNLYWEPLSFALPALQKGQRLRRLIDTAQPSPQDACEPDDAPTVYESSYRAEARSAVVLSVY